jgi:hypothetical protein
MSRLITWVLAWGMLSLAASQTPAGQPAVRSLRVFYFGNSLTGCTNPQWHEELGRSAGKEWTAVAKLGAGWQLWKHREELRKGGVVFDAATQGDLSIDPEQIQDRSGTIKRFFDEKWDAIVLQPFSAPLKNVTTTMWGKVTFDSPTDCGDVQSASDIISVYLMLNPQGRVYIYQDWPPMQPGKVPPDDGLPDWARPEDGRKVRITPAEFPLRDQFDYQAEWLDKKYVADHPGKPWLENPRCRDFHEQLFEALKGRFPTLWSEGRLTMIPVGEVFMALENKMQAGQFPGCPDIKDYYTDVQHIRAGLPRYTAAAAFYACLFREPPTKLDWRLYNDKTKYGDDPYHDAGELLEITPQRARLVNDTIWEQVASHPRTGIRQ